MKGLFIPGAPVIGNVTDNSDAGGNLSDIDLTSAVTDSRLVYACASEHAYYAADGTIQYAAPNAWPLEYRDGVAVGRHEPEPESTNLLKYSRQLTGSGASFHASNFVDNAGVGIDSQSRAIKSTANATGTGAYSRLGGISADAGEWLSFSLFYQRSDDVDIRTDISDMITAYLNTSTFELTGTVISGRQGRYSVDKFGDWARVKVSLLITASSNSVFVDFMRFSSGPTASLTTLIDGLQVENSGIISSPIFSNGTAKTRAGATASVKNPGGVATSIRVHYSDDTFTDFDFPAGGSDITIPASNSDWGTRYITRIEYFKGA